MNRGRSLLFTALVTTGVLLMGEAAATMFGGHTLLQWAAPVPLNQTDAPYLPGNPYLLWEMTPGVRTELGVDVTVNRLGLRGPEVAPSKPAGTRRIVITGDSSVYGHGVEDEKVFSRRLDVALGQGVEVINAGVPGYSSAQTLNLLQMRGWDTDPDVLVVGNLWSDNNFDSFVDGVLLSERTAFADSWAAPVSRTLQDSALYRVLDWHLRLAPRAKRVQKVGWMLGRAPSGPHRRVPVNDYAANLQALVDEAHSRGAEVIFLGLANSVDLGASTDGAHAWALYRQVMIDTAIRNGSPFIDARTAFEKSGLPWQDLFIDEMHPTEQGHQILADALSAALVEWVTGAALEGTPESATMPTYTDPFASGVNIPSPDAATASPTLSGTIHSPVEGPLQVDLVDLAGSSPPHSAPLVGSARFASSGDFSMPMPTSGRFGIRVYIDPAGDGPGQGDPMFEFFDSAIEAKGSSIEGLELDLKKN